MDKTNNRAFCNSCSASFSLKGWYSRADLLGTEYETIHYDYNSEDELYNKIEELAEQGKIKYQWKSDDKCPVCNSKNCTVI